MKKITALAVSAALLGLQAQAQIDAGLFAYPDVSGTQIVFSAIRRGQSDIYLYNVATKATTALTNDIYDNLNPRFSASDSMVLFSSDMPVLQAGDACQVSF